VWACAVLLGVLSIMGAMSIGATMPPIVLVLFVSAIVLSFSGPEGS
jgi:TRAP-type C4-dicarboxylate transport system permease large subunit